MKTITIEQTRAAVVAAGIVVERVVECGFEVVRFIGRHVVTERRRAEGGYVVRVIPRRVRCLRCKNVMDPTSREDAPAWDAGVCAHCGERLF